jgi:hypothetical protein
MLIWSKRHPLRGSILSFEPENSGAQRHQSTKMEHPLDVLFPADPDAQLYSARVEGCVPGEALTQSKKDKHEQASIQPNEHQEPPQRKRAALYFEYKERSDVQRKEETPSIHTGETSSLKVASSRRSKGITTCYPQIIFSRENSLERDSAHRGALSEEEYAIELPQRVSGVLLDKGAIRETLSVDSRLLLSEALGFKINDPERDSLTLSSGSLLQASSREEEQLVASLLRDESSTKERATLLPGERPQARCEVDFNHATEAARETAHEPTSAMNKATSKASLTPLEQLTSRALNGDVNDKSIEETHPGGAGLLAARYFTVSIRRVDVTAEEPLESFCSFGEVEFSNPTDYGELSAVAWFYVGAGVYNL